jgi:hypothetical protein
MFENDNFKDIMEPIDERCKGCSKVTEMEFCSSFIIPSKRWPTGEVSFYNKCVLADHIKDGKKKATFVNPIKASKRMMVK